MDRLQKKKSTRGSARPLKNIQKMGFFAPFFGEIPSKNGKNHIYLQAMTFLLKKRYILLIGL
jgi:hypothetical protein